MPQIREVEHNLVRLVHGDKQNKEAGMTDKNEKVRQAQEADGLVGGVKRTTATQVQDERTGKYYLQGREEAVKGLANVFGNGDFMPLTWPQAYDKTLVFEAEVVYCFSAVADDNAFDRSEVFRFRLWGWSATEAGAEPSVTMDWQDFNGDDPPGEPYGWNCLLIEAVERLREVRSGKALFTPLVVGAPSARA